MQPGIKVAALCWYTTPAQQSHDRWINAFVFPVQTELVTYQSERSTWSWHLNTDTVLPSVYTAWNSTHGVFISASYFGNDDGWNKQTNKQTTKQPLSRNGTTLPACPSSASRVDPPLRTLLPRVCAQAGTTTPTRTLRAPVIGARTLFSISWLADAVVNHASAREPGSPVAPLSVTISLFVLSLWSHNGKWMKY